MYGVEVEIKDHTFCMSMHINVVCVFAMQNVRSLTAKVRQQFQWPDINDAGHKINERIKSVVQSKKDRQVHLLEVRGIFCMNGKRT